MKKDISWMRGSFGISSHYTQGIVAYRTNGKVSYEDAVNSLNVEKLADTLSEIGCTHYIFTLTHGTQYLPFPCMALDKLLKGRTCKRDFLSELIAALSARGIRVIFYYNHSCNGKADVEWKEACGYAKGGKEALDAFAENICSIVREISVRYGDGISGWWFDSAYSVDPRGVYNTITTDMADWLFPWNKLVLACESGNSNAAVTINAGVGQHFRYYDEIDYWSGEMETLDYTPICETDDLQQTRWLPIEGPDVWTFSERYNDFTPPVYGEEELKKYLDVQLKAGNMVTFNVLIDADGTINPMAVELLKRVRRGTV